MYLHIGGGLVLRSSGIVGIFDFDNATRSETTRNYLRRAEKGDGFLQATEEVPKSFIVYGGGKGKREGFRVAISQISSSALIGRINRTKG